MILKQVMKNLLILLMKQIFMKILKKILRNLDRADYKREINNIIKIF